MPERNTLVLVAARPGPLQDSLVALVTTIREVSAVLIAEDGRAALRMAGQHSPAMVVTEADLGASDGSIVAAIKTRWPAMACVVLVDDAEARITAQEAGADHILTVGHPPCRLIEVIEALFK